MSNTRSTLNLNAISIADLQYNTQSRVLRNLQRSKRQSKSQSPIKADSPMSTTSVILDEKEDVKSSPPTNWHVLREREAHMLQSIKKFNIEESGDVQQWLATLHSTFEEVQYPVLHRVSQAITYLDDSFVEWYEKVRYDINNDWNCFTDRLKDYVLDRSRTQSQYPIESDEQQQSHAAFSLENLINTKFTKFNGEGNADEWLMQTMKRFKQCALTRTEQLMCLPFLFEDDAYLWYIKNDDSIATFDAFSKIFLQRFSSSMSTNTRVLADVSEVVPVQAEILASSDSISRPVSMTHLQQTVADELIKKPSYFRGAKDDVQDWLDRIEQRFKMAKWNDQQKLQFISVHLQDDAYRWWLQAANAITTWSNFVQAIKDSFGSTKATEIAFEQLKWYKQTVNQSVTQYHDKIMELCKKVDPVMSAAMKLKYLMTGVKDSLKLHISLHDPTTPEAFLHFARKIDDALSLNNIHQGSSPRNSNVPATTQGSPAPSYTTATSSHLYHQPTSHHPTDHLITQSSSHVTQPWGPNARYYNRSRYPSYQQQPIVCYTCGTPGHYSRDCTRHRF